MNSYVYLLATSLPKWALVISLTPIAGPIITEKIRAEGIEVRTSRPIPINILKRMNPLPIE